MIPAGLRQLDQWVVWRLERRDGKPTKVPYAPHTPGQRASSTDPATWSTYGLAVETAGAFDGIGFVFTKDDPYCGIDIDKISDESKRVVLTLRSYTERSVSGRGVHVIVRASLAGHARRRKDWLEVYDRGRFFVVTGRHLRGLPTTIEERQEQLDTVIAEHMPEAPVSGAVITTQLVTLDDQQLLDRMFRARNGAAVERLWLGDITGYPSHSEADMALCRHLAFWTGGDLDRVDRLFCASGLMREKWNRPSYREPTLQAALR